MHPSSSSSAKNIPSAAIEPGRLQFLERSFAEWLGLAGLGSEVDVLEEDGQALLHWLHELVFVQGHPVEWVRNTLLAANGGLRFIAISSGKGGVGKTTCSVNLAFAIAELGHRVLLVDADLGLGNVHVFAGVNPEFTIQDFIEHRVPLQDALCQVSENLQLLCGGAGVAGLANLDGRRMNRLLRHLRGLKNPPDIVLIDTGAGLSTQVLHFLVQAQEILVVTTPNIAATLDAYGLVKTVHEQGMSGKVRLLINQSADEDEARATTEKITACAEHFLGTAPRPLGFLTRETSIEASNQQRRPFLHDPACAANAARLLAMAKELTRDLRPAAATTPAQFLESSNVPSTTKQPRLEPAIA